MIDRNSKWAALVLCAVLAQGCVTWQVAKPTPVVSSTANYSIQLPPDWKYLTVQQTLVASLYGPQLQSIQIEYRKHKQAFKSLKRDSNPDMSAQELADAVIADMKAGQNSDVLDILKVEPALIAASPGFRAELASKRTFQGDGIRFRHVIYGVAKPDGLYLLRYEGPVLHYYDRYLPDFEGVVKSFAFLRNKARKT